MNKTYIFFDLDGTITDPRVGITKSVQYSLREFGIYIDNPDDLICFIGPPLRDSYRKYYSFTDEEAEKAVAKYREYFSVTGIFENELYDGMDVLLQQLKAQGKTLILATSKPTVYAEQILHHFNLAQYFTFVAGSELDGQRSEKQLVIQHAIDSLNIQSVQQTIMIGDREHDIIGANKVGMESIGVLYGYGSREEFIRTCAAYIIKSVGELSNLLMNGK